MQFTGNHAIYGGAVYVADNTNSGDCKPAQECPLQTLVTDSTYGENRNFLNMIFSEDNSATIAGSNLYGGLLDRCIPNPFAEVHQQWFERILSLYYNGVTYLRNISNITVESISSPPVKICFCISKGRPDCNYHLPTVQVKKGEAFTVPVVAFDNVNHLLNANIISSLSSTDGGFDEDQQTQMIKSDCTNLTFNVFWPHDFESITLAADGPCGSSSASVRQVHIEFINCTSPIGFEPSNSKQTRCECSCNSLLSPYISHCNSLTNTHHAPYNDKYRYWSGLLLLVRVTLYMTSAVTLSSNPQIPLLVTIILVGGIFFLKGLTGIAVNKKLYAEFIETAMYLNLLCYAAFTLYNFKNDSTKQAVVAYSYLNHYYTHLFHWSCPPPYDSTSQKSKQVQHKRSSHRWYKSSERTWRDYLFGYGNF